MYINCKNKYIDTENIPFPGWGDSKGRVYPIAVPREPHPGLPCQQLVSNGFLDLSIHYAIRSANLGGCTGRPALVLVSQAMLGAWGISRQALEAQAMENLENDGYWIASVHEVLREYAGDMPVTTPLPLYVMTNRSMLYGAAGILAKGIFPRFASEIGDNFYILPSSIHELLLIPDQGGLDPEELGQVVREVNRTQVAPGDRLANHVYYYDRETDGIGTRK